MALMAALLLPVSFLLAQTSTVNYGPSAEDFPNPERGFYRYSETKASSYDLLEASTISNYRNLQMPFGANYSVHSTLVFRYFVLDGFTAAPISQTYLDLMQQDFDSTRTAGAKLIVRFAYTIAPNSGSCAVGWNCPPYGDAPKSRILSHIAQLEPVLKANADVIAAVQMGFIGTWGENYYTDHFGDASPNGLGHLTSQNWTDRKEILQALLDALPAERMVQVRYPQMKQKFVHGNAAPTSSAAITPAQAHNGSDLARIGIHNDCLLASPADYGTYTGYDNPVGDDTTNLKPYFAAEGKFVVVGGETCGDADLDPFNNCAASGGGAYGDTELRRMHYSYLNADFNHDVNNDWTGTCMEGIKKNLGYRLALQGGTFTDAAQPGQSVTLGFTLVNEGYAAPFNPRGVEVVLRHATSGETWFAKLSDDPRFWLGHGATHTVGAALCLPSDLPTGNYEMLLNLPDPMASIYERPEYALRLANTLPGGGDVWEAATGYNQLGHQITVNGTASNATCMGEVGFVRSSAYSEACVQNLNIEGIHLPGGKYYSEGELTSSATTIAAGETVRLQSGSGVLLSQNFEVEAGAEMVVEIAACVSN